MRAVRLFAFGGPEVLQYIEVDTPRPGPGEVTVKIRGATVSGFDLLFRSGKLKQFPGRPPFALPFQLGREGAGEVVATGDGVTAWSAGDRVVVMPSPACGQCVSCRSGDEALCFGATQPGQSRFGTQAEYLTVKTSELLRAPDGVAFEILAAAVHSFVTVWHGAVTRGGLAPGQDVLITGAGGGLGTAAIVLAKYAGARQVIAVTGDRHKVARLRELGASAVIDWRQQDVPAVARELTSGRGVDLVVDHVGGELFLLGLQAVRLGGTVVAAAEISGTVVRLDLAQLVGKHVTIHGTRSSSRHEQELVLSLVGSGALRPVVSDVMPLSAAADAHRKLERQQHVGKIVLVP